MTQRKTSLPVFIIAAILLLGMAVVALFPFIYMLLTSFTQATTLDLNINFSEFSLINYVRVFKNFDFFNSLKNSVIVSGLSCILNCLFASMAAYGFAKKKFPGSNFLYSFYIITLMIPGQVTLIPVFSMMKSMHMLNTYLALVFPIINAFGVFLIKQFMTAVPDELLEAADMDGCNEIKKYFLIVLPLIKPVLISLTIFTFVTSWNDFLWPLVISTDPSMRTLTLALSVLKGNYTTNFGLVMAGSVLTFLPPFLLYIFLQKQFVEGVALSGIKG